MYATSYYSPGVYFPPLAPHVLSHCMVMYTPTGPPRCTPNSLSPAESVPHATPVSEYSQSSHGLPSDTYSGLKNRCNVWQFWSGCDVVLDRVRIMLSVGGVK